MTPHQQVEQCMERTCDLQEVTVYSQSHYPYGKQVVDESGDYIVFFYMKAVNEVLYFFKDAENMWFCDPRCP
ncbi:hypothetical protein [Halobacillus sp. Marseille-Q1614]|uniref:hypothetical protein n=1 Tax=Halobacillus sp. Marseille-Q1614 TaxID=2709134 RepID=UPI00156FC809|nr:hypothetical protein [Halobacillus sp. Marseille-Q1614]